MHRKLIAVDVGASPSRPNSMRNCIPCLTASRGASHGHFITGLRRKMSMQELLKVQGFSPDLSWQDCMSDRLRMRKALGSNPSVAIFNSGL
eukprot:6464516-Amphidinium_carterae.2